MSILILKTDTASMGVLTADSGLNLSTPNNVQLGGALLHDTTITTNGHSFSVVNNDDNTGIVYGDLPTDGLFLFAEDPLSNGSILSLSSVQAALVFQSDIGAGTIRIDLRNDLSILFSDSFNNLGSQYAADYSTAGTLNPRWIPDYAAVQAAVVAGSVGADNGLNVTGGNVELGGALTKNTTVDTTGFDLNISNANGNLLIHDNLLNATFNDPGDVNQQSFLNLLPSEAVFGMSNSGAAIDQNIDIVSGGMFVNDQRHTIGFVNGGDYSANIITNDNALMSTKSVKENVGFKIASNALSGQTATVAVLTYSPGGIKAQRLNVYLLYQSGTGTAQIDLTFTDGNNVPQSKTVIAPIAAAGFDSYVGIIVANNNPINIELTIVGTVTADVFAFAETLTP